MATSIYVGNLSYDSTEQGIRQLFEQYGEVLSVKMIEDRDTGRPRGFGFVEMDASGASSAIQALNGTDLDGRTLKVNEAKPRESRPPQRW
ncbi:MAG: RNA-binding protein [Desulfarculaceae bacterium]|nr:RNA-binding protein [Desulfarculaceae bacterium]MCF8049132.1 RNA-binding protein [Desulfarculaceae bacterium]MCF8065195.1 RNA-binding protein [Desulfarculaceae bacterium]MCF8099414.1 RNA-binding protein [Desulfarculaceae bacterium]MCF8122736.1 RNA-binding protein [Desulfarculaceae bacterium]